MRAVHLCAGTPEEAGLLAQALWHASLTTRPRACAAPSCALLTDARGALEDYEAVLAPARATWTRPRARSGSTLTRRTAQAAARAGRGEQARRLLADYCAQAPRDLDAQLELAELHRKAGAKEPLARPAAGALWPALPGRRARPPCAAS